MTTRYGMKETLSRREHQVLAMVLRGHSRREIAVAMHFDEHEVTHIVSGILQRAKGRADLTSSAAGTRDHRTN